ncbi:hypothetical protein REPUB_Repub16aG0026700 [Reevesia pubescens]
MDQHDIEACGTEKNIRRFKCPAQQDIQLKASGLSDRGTFSDEIARFEKRMPYHDHEIKSCKAAKVSETERKCLSYDNSSAFDCARQNTDGLRAPCSVVSRVSDSASMNKKCAKGTVMVMSPCNVLANERNSKDVDKSSDFIVAIDCSHSISMKEETSSEAGETLHKHENELLDGRTACCWLNAGENRLKSNLQGTYHDKQLKTESSSSNFTRAIFPASSNDSSEEASVDDKPSKCCQTDIADTSIFTGLKCKPKEPAASISTLDLAMQNCCRAVLDTIFLQGKVSNLDTVPEISDHVRARGDKMLEVITDHRSVVAERDDILKSSLPKTEHTGLDNQDKVENCYELDDALEVARRVAREVEQEVETDTDASGDSSCILGRSCETVHVNSVNSLALDKENCVTKTGGEIQLSGEQDNCDGFLSNKEVVDQEMLMGEEEVHVDIVESSLDFGSSITCAANCRQESSSIITNSDDLASNDRIIQPFQIDLNEDIVVNEVKCNEQLVHETVSYHVQNVSKPTPAMAKSGIPVYLPLSQLQLEDAVSWRGPAATSAFHPASVSKHFKGIQVSSASENGNCSKGIRIEGIDLNIAAAAVEFDMELLPEKCVPKSSGLPSKESLVEVSLTQAERYNIDLNFANENDDNCFQMAPPASARNKVRDFDLNDNPTSQDSYRNGDQPSQCTLESGDRAIHIPIVSFLGNAGQQRFNNLGSASWADPGPMQVLSHGHARPFLLTVSNVLPTVEQMQEIVPLLNTAPYQLNPRPEPPLAFPYGNGCCIEPTNFLSSTVKTPGVIPYITDQNGPTVFQQLVDSGTLPALPGYTSFLQLPGGPRPNSLAIIRPGFDLKSGVTFENRSMGENVRQHFVPPSNSLMEGQVKSFQPVALPATPMKRREPEGGWDPHQLGYGQVMSWH